jgi:Na+-transporting NADH:ubiquinone oxidoreductase subunit D
MASNVGAPPAGAQAARGLFAGKGRKILKAGVWVENPLGIQVLGVCSTLAVTNQLSNSLVMGLSLVLVCGFSNLFVSMLRNAIPKRIRLMVELAIISVLVIVVQQFLSAFYWSMSERLGPYVGLIITNCIVLGRTEAFALANPPLPSMLDGMANGLGYACVLAIIGTLREMLGSGTILGHTVLSASWYTPNQLMVLAPGAFFALGFVIAGYNIFRKPQEDQKAKP